MAVGDWDDLDSAVEVAQTPAQVSKVSRTDAAGGGVRYELVAITDEPGELFAFPASGYVPGPRPIKIELWARIGRYGDRTRERILLEAVASRLHDLAGVDTAPIRR